MLADLFGLAFAQECFPMLRASFEGLDELFVKVFKSSYPAHGRVLQDPVGVPETAMRIP